MTITIQSEGRRHYLIGDTYPIKDAIRAAGCRFDGARKAWWTGKREVAESLLSAVQAGEVKIVAGFAKLPNGTWGVRVPASSATPGAKVEVDGKYGRKTVTIAEVVEARDGSAICAIVAEPRKARSSGGDRSSCRAGRRTGCSCGSREDSAGDLIPSPHNCRQCNFDAYDC